MKIDQRKGVLAVALSGGVDSSAAAAMLKGKYPNCIGAMHRIWPDAACCAPENIQRASDLCKSLDMPFYVIDLEKEFADRVVDPFCNAYIEGETPNPCVLCNELVRFSLFYHILTEKLTEDAILFPGQILSFATGHYARIEEHNGMFSIHKGRDEAKDQSYMLYRVPLEMLPRLVFPLGETLKEDIFRYARKKGLPSAALKESQDICFVDTTYTDFLQKYKNIETENPGSIITEEGKVIGRHRGYLQYTIGQRKGLNLSDGPWYVSRLMPEENTIVVGRIEEIQKDSFSVGSCNWHSDMELYKDGCSVKIRYNSPEIPCTVSIRDKERPEVKLHRKAVITPGQSAVFYSGDMVLGGGIICRE